MNIINVIFLAFTLSFILVHVSTHPPKYPLNIPPSVYKADYEDVIFTSEDGISLFLTRT